MIFYNYVDPEYKGHWFEKVLWIIFFLNSWQYSNHGNILVYWLDNYSIYMYGVDICILILHKKLVLESVHGLLNIFELSIISSCSFYPIFSHGDSWTMLILLQYICRITLGQLHVITPGPLWSSCRFLTPSGIHIIDSYIITNSKKVYHRGNLLTAVERFWLHYITGFK